jgi:DNA-binding NarL/FixJ family response regulator
MTEPIKLMVVDDHDVVRAGLSSMLADEADINLVGEAKDGFEAIKKSIELRPDVILMDIFMPGCDGLEAMMRIHEHLPSVKVVILTVSEREEDLLRVLRFGAGGYLLKSANIVEIAKAVRTAAAGEVVLSPHIATRLVAQFREKAGEPMLSSREREILQLLSQGLTNNEIGNRLFISESTVITYLRRLLNKLHLKNRAEAIAYAARQCLTGKAV